MNIKIGVFTYIIGFMVISQSCTQVKSSPKQNPFQVDLNVPVDYANVSADDVERYANATLDEVTKIVDDVKNWSQANFSDIFVPLDDIENKLATAKNNCYMLYWVSPDATIREKGLAGHQMLETAKAKIFSDREIYAKMKRFKSSGGYAKLKGHRKTLVDDMLLNFERGGVNLEPDKLKKFQTLMNEIGKLSSEYSTNMNASNEILVLDEAGVEGLPEKFKAAHKTSDGKYKIPVNNANNETVMGSAGSSETREAFYKKFYGRASDKNLVGSPGTELEFAL